MLYEVLTLTHYSDKSLFLILLQGITVTLTDPQFAGYPRSMIKKCHISFEHHLHFPRIYKEKLMLVVCRICCFKYVLSNLKNVGKALQQL